MSVNERLGETEDAARLKIAVEMMIRKAFSATAPARARVYAGKTEKRNALQVERAEWSQPADGGYTYPRDIAQMVGAGSR